MGVCSPSREQMSCSGRSRGGLGAASGLLAGFGAVLRGLAHAGEPTLKMDGCRPVSATCFCRGWLFLRRQSVQSVRILPSDVPREDATSGFRGSTVPIHGFTEEKNPKEATQTNTQTACFLHAREYIAEIFKNLYV